MANLISSLLVRLIDGVTGPAGKMNKSLLGVNASLKGMGKGGELNKLYKQLKQIGDYRGLEKGLARDQAAYEKARQKIRDLGREIMATSRPTKQLKTDYERAADAARKLGEKISASKQALNATAQALGAAGNRAEFFAKKESAIVSQIDRVNSALRRQNDVLQRNARLRTDGKAALAAAGAYVGYKAAQGFGNVLGEGAEMDYMVRRQRVYAGLPEVDQKGLLLPQATRIGTDTKFSNTDVVEAQSVVAQRLPEELKKGSIIAPIIDQVKNYALGMKGVDMNMSAEAVTGFMQSAGKDISTPEKALSEARKSTNLLLRMAQLSGMSHDDLMPFVQRGISAGRLAGLSPETMGAMAIAMKRANISGDQIGTAMRTMSSKLVAPTQKGLGALSSIGIDYADYTKMPGAGLSVDNLGGKLKSDFGVRLSTAQQKELAEALSDEDIIGDQGAYVAAVQEIVAKSFKSGKNGKMKTADAAKLAKSLNEFYKYSVENVDVEGLLMAIMEKDPSLGVLNAMFTDKHGNKLGLVPKDLERFKKDRESLKQTPDDFGDKAAAEITGGLGGAYERFKGSIDNLTLSVASANSTILTWSLDKIGNAIDLFGKLPGPLQQVASGLALIGASYGGAKGALTIFRMLTSGGSAVALTGSAAALTESAVALNLAAANLGGGSVADLASGKKGKGGVGGLMGWVAAVLKGAALPAAAVGSMNYVNAGNEVRPVTPEMKAKFEEFQKNSPWVKFFMGSNRPARPGAPAIPNSQETAPRAHGGSIGSGAAPSSFGPSGYTPGIFKTEADTTQAEQTVENFWAYVEGRKPTITPNLDLSIARQQWENFKAQINSFSPSTNLLHGDLGGERGH